MNTKGKEVKLQHSITVNGVQTNTLFFGRMKTKHLKLLPNEVIQIIEGADETTFNLGIVAKLIPFFAALADIKVEEAEEIDITDLMSVAEILTDILGN